MNMSEQTTREVMAEFIGTFMLVFVGAGAAIMAASGDIVPVALAHGLILVAIIATFGHISGAHVNPAVTVAMWISGHLETSKTGWYLLAQFLAGFVAAAVLWVVIPESNLARATLGQTRPINGVNQLDIILVEGLITFFLVSVIYQTAVYGRGGAATPVIIGLTLAGAFMFAGPLTGAAANPARMLGPALVGGDRQEIGDIVVYLLSIFGGGALAAFLHMDTFKPADAEEPKGQGLRRMRSRK